MAAPARRLSPARLAPALALAAVCALAAALRFANFAAVGTTPFYDAAVRSMGLSWHDFFYGALDPSGQLSIDKPPIDLWLQVASTKLLGFSSVSLRLPPAIAGTLAVPLLYDVVRRGYGRWAGVAAALAFAVLPSTVLTSRSDTMDTVMAALLILAAWLIVRARPERRVPAVVAAGAVAGLAFEVKLSEALIALPALALLAWVALDAPRARKWRTFALAGLAYLAVASSWAVVASLLPGHHPFAYGSSDGQIWNAILVYNGLHRFTAPPTRTVTAPLLLRLFDPSPPRHVGELLGVELLPALVVGGLAAAAGCWPRARSLIDDRQRLRSAVGWGLAAWLVVGAAVVSVTGRLMPRYLESFSPAVAAVLGIGIVSLARVAVHSKRAAAALVACAAAAPLAGLLIDDGGQGTAVAIAVAPAGAVVAAAAARARAPRRMLAAAAALVLAAALVVPFTTSMRLVRAGAGDAEPTGTMPPARLDRLSAYLRAHQGTARYEVAAQNIFDGVALIIKDARPVLTLTSVGGRPLVTPAQLARDTARGEVHYALVGARRCRPGTAGAGFACAPIVQWARAHGIDVSLAAGLPHGGMLYRLRSSVDPSGPTWSRRPARRSSHPPLGSGRAARPGPARRPCAVGCRRGARGG